MSQANQTGQMLQKSIAPTLPSAGLLQIPTVEVPSLDTSLKGRIPHPQGGSRLLKNPSWTQSSPSGISLKDRLMSLGLQQLTRPEQGHLVSHPSLRHASRPTVCFNMTILFFYYVCFLKIVRHFYKDFSLQVRRSVITYPKSLSDIRKPHPKAV